MSAALLNNSPRQISDTAETVCRCQDYAKANVIARFLMPGHKGPEICRWCRKPVPAQFALPAHDTSLAPQLGSVGASNDGSVSSHVPNMDVERTNEQEAEGHAG